MRFFSFTQGRLLLRDINKQESYKISLFFEESLVYLDEYLCTKIIAVEIITDRKQMIFQRDLRRRISPFFMGDFW